MTSTEYTEILRSEGIESAKIDAITSIDGPLLVIAGPGSGKTKTLVERVVYLILSGVESSSIMVSTFTEKAAKELITRISNRLIELDLKVNLNEMYIGTLHSIFLRLLEDYREHTRLKKNYRVLDDFDQKYFVYRNLKPYLAVDNIELLVGNHKVPAWEKAQSIIYYISKVREECIDDEKLLNSDNDGIKAIGEISKIYSQQLAGDNALDFSTIQSETFYLLDNAPEVATKLSDALRYIMVDEYQDTNTIQERILLKLSEKHKNICVVGDDDQGLYRFRGATIRNILEFPGNFPAGSCKEVCLSTNYRSHPGIINFYNRWMNQEDWTQNGTTFRFEKEIKSEPKAFPDYSSVFKVSSIGESSGYFEEVYEFINDLRERKIITNLNQVAFLFRSVKNDNVIELSNYLEFRGMKVFSPRSSLFFERREVELMMGALVFMFPNLEEQLKWNDGAQLDVWQKYKQWKMIFANAIRFEPKRHDTLLKFCQKRAKEHLTFTGKTTYSFAGLVYQLLEYPMFADPLEADMKGNKTDLRACYNIAMITKLLGKFEYLYNVTVLASETLDKTLQNLFNHFFRFIIDGGIEEYEDFDEYAPSDCISFMTIHQSKGLEFPVTIVGSLNSVPRKQHDELDVKLQDQYYIKPPFEPIEKTKHFDFRRLFYTAFSRAQNILVLSCHEKDGKGKTPSKYFTELYDKLPHWRKLDFNPNVIKLADVKPVNIKHEYSFTSHILLYENCPLQYKFYKELEFVEIRQGAVIGGSLLHQTIEDIHKTVLRGHFNELTDQNISQWFENNYYLLSKQLRSYLHQPQRDALLKQVLRYRDANSGKWDRIKEAEVEVSLVKEDYILTGKIDLIKGENDTVELIDFKSGDKPDVNSTDPISVRTLTNYRRQLEVYAHLVEERTGYKVSNLHLYYPKEHDGIPTITFPYDKAIIDRTVKEFEQVVRKIEDQNYSMNKIVKSEKQCGDCDMRFHCNPAHYKN